LNEERVEQAIRRHERWLAEQENAIQPHTDAILRHDEALLKHEQWRQEFWTALRAAIKRGDKTDRRLDRLEREGTRLLRAQQKELDEHRRSSASFWRVPTLF
jgi:hypothetical protein